MKELGVKVGDKVIFHGSWGNRMIAEVTRITPTGRIRIDRSDSQYDKFGRELGANVWNTTRLSRWSEEVEKEIADERRIKVALDIAHGLTSKDMTLDKAKVIIDMFLKREKA